MIKNPPDTLVTTDPLETKYYGLHACAALFKSRPKDIRKVYVHADQTKVFAKLLKHCAQHKIAYKVTDTKALSNVSASTHHEGICIIAIEKTCLNQKQFIESLGTQTKLAALYLDSIQNPHNIGAIARSAAHFGYRSILLPAESAPRLSGASYRIAEGGFEHVDIVKVDNIDKLAHKLSQHEVQIIGTSSHSDKSLYDYRFPDKFMIVLGNEVKGTSNKLKSLCKDHLIISGTGKVESLNVSLSAGVIMAESYRQNFHSNLPGSTAK